MIIILPRISFEYLWYEPRHQQGQDWSLWCLNSEGSLFLSNALFSSCMLLLLLNAFEAIYFERPELPDKMCGDDSFYLYKEFWCLEATLSPCPPCIVLIWMYPRIIQGNFVKDCPNNLQFNPNNCLNIPLLDEKSTREKSSPGLNFRFESKPISQVLFLGFVFNSRDALLVESWCLNWYKTLYLHAAGLQTDPAVAVHHISKATGKTRGEYSISYKNIVTFRGNCWYVNASFGDGKAKWGLVSSLKCQIEHIDHHCMHPCCRSRRN